MSGSFKHKLLRYEPAPPSGTWARIAGELDKEFFPSDAVLASKIDTASIPPPDAAWAGIESFLDNEPKPAKGTRVVSLVYRRLAAAVILAAVISGSMMYVLTGRQNDRLPGLSAVRSNPNFKTEVSSLMHVPSPAKEIPVKAFTALLKTGVPKLYAQAAFASNDEEPERTDIDEARFTDMRTVNAELPVNVPARPIRDAGGNIIMDIKLISRPNDPYITVTGPNGSQTKISSKFLSCLSSLNAEISSDETSDNGIMWKDKFQAWRDKLLNEASFIPAAGNFFDIFEMKDMIEEQ